MFNFENSVKHENSVSIFDPFLLRDKNGWLVWLILAKYKIKICRSGIKYYIYIQRLFNNNTLDLYVCLTQLKQAWKIEENICRKNNNEDNFFKFHFIYEKL